MARSKRQGGRTRASRKCTLPHGDKYAAKAEHARRKNEALNNRFAKRVTNQTKRGGLGGAELS